MDVLKTCDMHTRVMGMSAMTFWSSRKGGEDYRAMMQDRAGVPVSCGSFSCEGARMARGASPSCHRTSKSRTRRCGREASLKLDGDDVDAIVQVGTNLSMVRLAAAAELFLGQPVIAINTATYWDALRAAGVRDRIDGFGRLLTHH